MIIIIMIMMINIINIIIIIYTNLEGKISLSIFSKKCLKTPLLTCFLKNFACNADNLVKMGSL